MDLDYIIEIVGMSSPHNPYGAEAAILYDSNVNTVVDDDLASGVAKPSTDVALIMDHR